MSTAQEQGVAHGWNSADSGADVALVTQVVLAERQGRDRGWWEQMADRYWPDSTVQQRRLTRLVAADGEAGVEVTSPCRVRLTAY
ncbi:hypothetical protein ACWEWQ_38800, partial [Streptomyces sp. NPDC003832]